MNIAHRVTNSVLNRILLLAVQNDIYCIDNLYNVHYVPKRTVPLICHIFEHLYFTKTGSTIYA